MRKTLLRQFLLYFFRGLLLTAPIFATIYCVVAILHTLDGMFGFNIFPGVGVLIFVVGVFVVGYYSSSVIFKYLTDFIESLLTKNTLTRLIYTSIKDMMQAFVGDKKSFNNPVLFKLNKNDECYRVGFVTAEQLTTFGLEDYVGVYMPQSYAFAGHLLLVPRENIKTISGIPAADMMKFAVSGGVSQFSR